MARINAGDLRERVTVLTLRLQEEDNQYQWAENGKLWADAQPDTRSNLFSSVGIGVKGITFTVRNNRELSLHHAFSWRGRHCFLTAILPHDHPGYLTVQTALVEAETVELRPDREGAGLTFPGVLTEKYARHEQAWPMSANELGLVLVTPKAVTLRPGCLVQARGAAWEVLVPHELDPYKNEYEIGRRAEL